MPENDINVNYIIRANTDELRKAVKDFDGSAEAVKRLDIATKNLRDSTQSQSSAIAALNKANRVQHFQLMEGIRTIRSFTSVARDLNQVYQTLILQNIDATQTTIAQRLAFNDLSDSLTNLGNAFDIVGDTSEVQQGFDEMIKKADSLSSDAIQDLIDQAEKMKASMTLSPEDLAKWNEFIANLKELKNQTITEEEAKRWEDFFGTFTNAALAAGGVSQLAANLGKYKTEIMGLIGFVGRFKPEIAIIVLLLFGESAARELGLLQTAGDGGEDMLGKVPAPDGSRFLDWFLTGKQPAGTIAGGDVNITIQNATLSSDVDMVKFAGTLAHIIEQERSAKEK